MKGGQQIVGAGLVPARIVREDDHQYLDSFDIDDHSKVIRANARRAGTSPLLHPYA
jgi:hypothetical protein